MALFYLFFTLKLFVHKNTKQRIYFIIYAYTDGKYGGKELFTFDDIFNSTFTPKTFDVQWVRLNGQYDSHDGSSINQSINHSFICSVEHIEE